jgi:uncharacterized membrane protein
MKARVLARPIIALAMTAVGVMHFVNPDPFVKIVPAFLPAPLALVYISGVFEIVLGWLLIPERTRPLGKWGLIALFVAVFPANINMAVNQIQLSPESPMPGWMMWARLPFQLLFVGVVWWAGQPEGRSLRSLKQATGDRQQATGDGK